MGNGRIGQSFAASQILDLVQEDLKRVEREICLDSIASVDAITAIGRYLHDGGGKRLRPILLLLTAKLARSSMNGQDGDAHASDAAIRLAAVVEMIHTATLVHDDVIDIAETRRGRPTPNVIWGNHASVLAGDWLYMQAFQVALRQRNFHILDILIALTQLMVEGELLQMERIGNIAITEADYMELVDRKTASLFSACARLGAVVADGDEVTESRLAEFGWNLGIAFQLVDDVLDLTSHENVLGKPVGNDLREGKVTLALVYALDSADEDARRLVETVLKDGDYGRAAFQDVLAVVQRHRGIEKAMERAQTFAEKARTIISMFPDSVYQRALLAMTELVTERDR
jgi:octaprenyl-diphosphate synthase